MSKRKGAWRFSTVWTFPGHMVATASTDPVLIKNELQHVETEMKRLVLGAQRFPLYLRNIQLKYMLSDWELARTKTPIRLPVEGYIQSKKQRAIDYDNVTEQLRARTRWKAASGKQRVKGERVSEREGQF